jgi:hypothetical protein
VRTTREVAAASLDDALATASPGVSESELAHRWVERLRGRGSVLRDGWYLPPPHGVSVLFGDPPDYGRVRYASLRGEQCWPREDIALRNDSLIFAYASPVDRTTGMIGDLAVSLYRGADNSLQRHLASCLTIAVEVASRAEVGMRFAELYELGSRLIADVYEGREASSLENYTGVADIGHTAPWSYCDPTSGELDALKSGNALRIATTVSRARVFVGPNDQLRVEPTMAFSIEPRIALEHLPVACFHVWVTFIGGRKQVVSGFARLFERFGMERYLPSEALTRLR